MPKSKSTTPTPPAGRFVFRGSAIPIGGRVLRVGEDRTPYNLQSPPASALSVAGGHCDAARLRSVAKPLRRNEYKAGNYQGKRDEIEVLSECFSHAFGSNCFVHSQRI